MGKISFHIRVQKEKNLTEYWKFIIGNFFFAGQCNQFEVENLIELELVGLELTGTAVNQPPSCVENYLSLEGHDIEQILCKLNQIKTKNQCHLKQFCILQSINFIESLQKLFRLSHFNLLRGISNSTVWWLIS